MLADRWGVSDADTTRHFPCDDLVPAPVLQAWRGVTVHTTPDRVWPWVRQIRLAPYSYDWLDNLGRRSPRAIVGLSDPVAGDPFTAVGGHEVGRVLSVEPGIALTGRIMGAVMSYVLVRSGDDTRLLLKIVTARGRLTAPLLSAGDLVMSRRQLRTWAALAERDRRSP